MIDYEHNLQPEPKKPAPNPTPSRELEDWLNAQDFRPFGYEW